jgi:hypothetical protein
MYLHLAPSHGRRLFPEVPEDLIINQGRINKHALGETLTSRNAAKFARNGKGERRGARTGCSRTFARR